MIQISRKKQSGENLFTENYSQSGRIEDNSANDLLSVEAMSATGFYFCGNWFKNDN